MNDRPSDLQTRRGRFFFWLGLIILPVFWVWWMKPAYFSKAQRRAAWVWTGCYIMAMILFREALGRHAGALLFGYPVVAVRLGVALWLWLLFRVVTVLEAFMVYILGGEVFVAYAQVVIPAWRWLEASPAIFIFALVPAALHLAVEPVRRWRREIEVSTVESIHKWARIFMCAVLLIIGCCTLWVQYHKGGRPRAPANARQQELMK